MPMRGDAHIAYGVAKAAQDKLTKNLAFEYAPKGVRVNSVLPGEPVLGQLHYYSRQEHYY
jgi:NAD(P)-dependent dehydrogenase (short-subunit alcohol dehydrogenase family)